MSLFGPLEDWFGHGSQTGAPKARTGKLESRRALYTRPVVTSYMHPSQLESRNQQIMDNVNSAMVTRGPRY